MFADRTCEETVCPEFASPQLFLDLGAPPENLAGRHALQHPDDLRHTVGRHGLNQKMYVILVRAYLQKLHLVALRNFQAHFFQHFINAVVEHCSSVFCQKYQVVHQHRYVVAFVDIFAHPQSLRRKRRGIRPEEIKAKNRIAKFIFIPFFEVANNALPEHYDATYATDHEADIGAWYSSATLNRQNASQRICGSIFLSSSDAMLKIKPQDPSPAPQPSPLAFR